MCELCSDYIPESERDKKIAGFRTHSRRVCASLNYSLVKETKTGIVHVSNGNGFVVCDSDMVNKMARTVIECDETELCSKCKDSEYIVYMTGEYVRNLLRSQ